MMSDELFPHPTPADVADGLCDVKAGSWKKAPPPGRHPKAIHVEHFSKLPGYVAPAYPDKAGWSENELAELLPKYKGDSPE